MTYQRTRGIPYTIWRSVQKLNNRGDRQYVVDKTLPPHTGTAWVQDTRSGTAEVPGQQQIRVIKIGTTENLADVNAWSQVEFLGAVWDVVTPPAYHHGVARHTRHWSLDLRERP